MVLNLQPSIAQLTILMHCYHINSTLSWYINVGWSLGFYLIKHTIISTGAWVTKSSFTRSIPLKGRLVWDDDPRIKDDLGRDDEIILFGCILIILHDGDFGSPPLIKLSSNTVIENRPLRIGIQYHSIAMILD